MAPPRKKLIEVALPLEAINAASAREKSIRHGHPSTLHLWWARRPLAACRAVLFAQLVDDPSSWPERFPTEEAQRAERKRLHDFIAKLVLWESSNDERVLDQARWYIARSLAWGRREEPPDNAGAVRGYLLDHAPPVYDPFCGGGSIPLEAQRLGLRAYGSDLNPVAVMISKALVEFPPKFAGLPPVNPEARRKLSNGGVWNAKGAQGLAEDVRYYGRWMRDEAKKRIGHLYPDVDLPDGSKATVIAWLWARTIASPNPAAKGAHVPLVRSFELSTKPGKKVWVEPILDRGTSTYSFAVRSGGGSAPAGTISKVGARCILTDVPIPLDYVRAEGRAGRIRTRLMAVVAQGHRGRLYLQASEVAERTAERAQPSWVPDGALPTKALGFRVQEYGLLHYSELFSERQQSALSTLSDLVLEARDLVCAHIPLSPQNGNVDPDSYARTVATYLALCVSKQSNRSSNLCFWDTQRENVQPVFSRQAISMTFEYAEANVFSESTGSFTTQVDYASEVIAASPIHATECVVSQKDALQFG